MELFLLLVPAVIVPVGLSLAGIWWLMAEGDEDDGLLEDDFGDGF